MPLPDERPRQSVANLIGRFEQQTKKQVSPSAPTASLPRTTSVTSQISGDAAKEEAKEKREWPPKSLKVEEKTTVTPSSSVPVDLAQMLQPAPPSNGTAAPPAPMLVPEPESPPLPVESAATKSLAAKISPGKPPKVPSTSTVSHSVSSPVKIPAAKSANAGAHADKPISKTPVKSPPKTSFHSPAAPPLRPQLTGQSTTSTTSAARLPKSTPMRPKTPSRPSVGSSRPKTPSSGLYAPTAASLAKSRNAPPTPTPVKKATLNPEVAERLSKPTAASLSKARSINPATTTPPRGPKMTTPPTRGTLKPRIGLAGARVREQTKAKAQAQAAKAGKDTSEHNVPSIDLATIMSKTIADEAVPETSELTRNGTNGEMHHHEQEEVVHEGDEEEHAVLEDIHPPEEEPIGGPFDGTEIQVHEGQAFRDDVAEELAGPDSPTVHEQQEHEAHEDLAADKQESKDLPPVPHTSDDTINPPSAEHDPSTERHDEVKPRVSTRDDLEDIVNLLESGPDLRRASLASIPDEYAGEIPDEE